jgi:hypothetical protein
VINNRSGMTGDFADFAIRSPRHARVGNLTGLPDCEAEDCLCGSRPPRWPTCHPHCDVCCQTPRKSLRDSRHVLELFPANLAATNRPCDGAHKKYECDTKLFLFFVSARLRICGFAPKGPYSAMRNEHSRRDTPRSALCPSCSQIMRRAQTTPRFDDLPDLYIFECRACGVFDVSG